MGRGVTKSTCKRDTWNVNIMYLSRRSTLHIPYHLCLPAVLPSSNINNKAACCVRDVLLWRKKFARTNAVRHNEGTFTPQMTYSKLEGFARHQVSLRAACLLVCVYASKHYKWHTTSKWPLKSPDLSLEPRKRNAKNGKKNEGGYKTTAFGSLKRNDLALLLLCELCNDAPISSFQCLDFGVRNTRITCSPMSKWIIILSKPPVYRLRCFDRFMSKNPSDRTHLKFSGINIYNLYISRIYNLIVDFACYDHFNTFLLHKTPNWW